MSTNTSRQPVFDFVPPKGYTWLLERGMIGYTDDSAFEPWFYLDRQNVFSVTEKWPHGPQPNQLVAFARRYDSDDIACFAVQAQVVTSVVVIHGWTNTGYDVVASYPTFWEWLKSVIDDIADWLDVVE